MINSSTLMLPVPLPMIHLTPILSTHTFQSLIYPPTREGCHYIQKGVFRIGTVHSQGVNEYLPVSKLSRHTKEKKNHGPITASSLTFPASCHSKSPVSPMCSFPDTLRNVNTAIILPVLDAMQVTLLAITKILPL